MSHLPMAIDISCRKRPRRGRNLRRRKQFAEFQEQVTQSIIPENPDQIREIKNFDEFSSLFESLLERAESTIPRKRTENVASLGVPGTSLKFRQVYEHKPLVKRLGQKSCEPQFSKLSNLESGVPVIDLASESESSIINLSSDSETEVPSDAETIVPQSLESIHKSILISDSEF